VLQLREMARRDLHFDRDGLRRRKPADDIQDREGITKCRRKRQQLSRLELAQLLEWLVAELQHHKRLLAQHSRNSASTVTRRATSSLSPATARARSRVARLPKRLDDPLLKRED
jgi:hypothetical protein